MFVAVKALALVSVAFSLVSASDAPAPQFVNYPAIHQVICDGGKGSAFEAGGVMVSVNHVTENYNCTINGQFIVAKAEPIDFSTVDLPATGYRVNCDGFKENEHYWAIGYAGGHPFQRMIHLVGTGNHAGNGMALLIGYPTVIPGMSGGPILDSRGRVVGTINMYSRILPLSFSTELKGTTLCR